ncbi:hypothetical protein [Legionella sp. WA2024007413]
MKILEIYRTNEWLTDNTRRQKFREMTKNDFIDSTKKVLKAVPILTIAGAGFSKGLQENSIGLTNLSLHILKEVHNGIGYSGKFNECEFYEPIDLTTQRFQRDAASDLASPFVKLWLVTDDEEVKGPEITRGVLFHSHTEAIKFQEMYPSLEAYTQSSFYKAPNQIVCLITENTLPVFDEELDNFLANQGKSYGILAGRPEITARNFRFIRLYEGQPENLVIGSDGSNLIEIDFPEAVSKKDYNKYFPRTAEQSRVEDVTQLVNSNLKMIEEEVAELELSNDEEESHQRRDEREKVDELKSTEYYEFLAEESETTDLTQNEESEHKSEKKTQKKNDSDAEKEDISDEMNREPTASKTSSDLPEEKKAPLTKSSSPLARSMKKGVFKTLEKEAVDSDKKAESVVQPKDTP